MEIGSALEDFTSAKAKKGIEKLISLRPETARVRRDNVEEVIPSKDVRIGDTVIVLAGETIPVDGIISRGTTAIDQSPMTGESIPVDKTVGDQVISGTINRFKVFEFTSTGDESDSTLSRMIRLAKEADENKAPIVKLADRWATWLVVILFVCTILIFGINLAVTASFSTAFLRAVTVLIVFCPCAFVLATPTAIMAGIGNATRHGMIIKSGDALQRFGEINTVAFDKTGTLTTGKPSVSAYKSAVSDYTDDEILKLMAFAEYRSEHPLGKAIVEAYTGSGNAIEPVRDFEVIAGNGVTAVYKDLRLIIGKESLLRSYDIAIDSAVYSDYSASGDTVIHLAVDQTYAGFVVLADTLRDSARIVVEALDSIGVETVLLTGDNLSAASGIASEAGVKTVKAELLPEKKQEIINEYRLSGKKVCMIGDGINDSLALKTADAAIAMGGIGSDIAVESSDVVLVNDDIRQIPHLILLSGKVLRKIKTNIIISMSLNIIATILAATGILKPVVGALVHNCGSVFVVINTETVNFT